MTRPASFDSMYGLLSYRYSQDTDYSEPVESHLNSSLTKNFILLQSSLDIFFFGYLEHGNPLDVFWRHDLVQDDGDHTQTQPKR